MKPKTKFKSKKYINNTKKIKGGGAFLGRAIGKAALKSKAGKQAIQSAVKSAAKSSGKTSGSQGSDKSELNAEDVSKMLDSNRPPDTATMKKGMEQVKGALPDVNQMKSSFGSMGGSFNEMTFTKFLSLSLEALLKTAASITTLPIRNIDEFIPPEICKIWVNPFSCSQSVLQYLFTGTKPDHRKVLPESDKNDCISYDQDGNKIVHCKQKGGSNTKKYKYKGKKYGKQYGGKGMIIECSDSNIQKNSTSKSKGLDKNKLIKYLKQNLGLLLNKLKKLNTYLRKYLCPKDKLEALIENVNDIMLLKKTYEVCNILLKDYKYDNNKTDTDRLKTCDDEYTKLGKGTLRVQSDTKHLGILIFPRGGKDCDDCTQLNLWAETLGKYYSLFKGSINGNTNNIHYIIMNIIRDLAKMDTNQTDGIIKEIADILKNIECRTNLTQVIKDRINKLNNLGIKNRY